MRRATGIALPATAAVALGAYGAYRRWTELVREKAADVAVEAHLPTMETAQSTQVIRVPRLLDESDISQVHALHDSMAASLGSASARGRSATASSYKTGAAMEPQLQPGWQVTYLNTDGAFAERLPALREKILHAARRVDAQNFGVLQAATEPIVPRCVEYHVVVPPGSLPHPYHNDEGSALTVDIMLSEAGSFTGGDFSTLETSGELITHPFERGDALVFVSHKPHWCVCVCPPSVSASLSLPRLLHPPRYRSHPQLLGCALLSAAASRPCAAASGASSSSSCGRASRGDATTGASATGWRASVRSRRRR